MMRVYVWRRYSTVLINLNGRYRYKVSHMLQLLYTWEKYPLYRINGPQSQYECFWRRENHLPLPGVKP